MVARLVVLFERCSGGQEAALCSSDRAWQGFPGLTGVPAELRWRVYDSTVSQRGLLHALLRELNQQIYEEQRP